MIFGDNSEDFYQERYSGREVAESLNDELLNMTNSFIKYINLHVGKMGYEVSLAGSLSRGAAIYNKDDRLFIKDIDFSIQKESGQWLTRDEAAALRKDETFFRMVKLFLIEAGRFYVENNIENHINEADFIYDRNNGVQGTFAIGSKSIRALW